MKKLAVLALLALAVSQPTSAAPASATKRVIVAFQPGASAAAKAAVRGVGGELALDLGPQNAAAFYLPEAAIAGLSHNPNIAYIEEDVLRGPSAQATPWGVAATNAPTASLSAVPQPPVPTTTPAIKVCIIDSGYGLGHDDLASTLNVTGSFNTGTGNWYDDTCGHGSHVAGTISALDNTDGVVGVIGNNNIALHIVKVFGGATTGGCGWAYSSSLVTALNECQSAGANVVSMSLGGGASSRTEQSAFDAANTAGVLSIAAAGNGGNTTTSYPAGYASVMSVAAVDSALVKAVFSQANADVEIAAPGVDVESTVPFGSLSTVTVNGATFTGVPVEFSREQLGVTGDVVDGGLCTAAGAWAGKVVVCQRGTNSFLLKVQAVQAGGGVAAVIYNSAAGLEYFTLGAGNTSTIPAVCLAGVDGPALLAHVGGSAVVDSSDHNPAVQYDVYNGTSMATPHVSAVAALIWAQVPGATNTAVRRALLAGAQDRGTVGKDNSYGYGFLRAPEALKYLQTPVGQQCRLSKETCSASQACCAGACVKSGRTSKCQ